MLRKAQPAEQFLSAALFRYLLCKSCMIHRKLLTESGKLDIFYMNIKYILKIRSRSNGSFFIFNGCVTVYGVSVEYTSLDSVPYYPDCSPLVAGLGYVLVELRVVPQHGIIRVTAVIACPVSDGSCPPIGVNDCAKVHRVLLPRMEALLNSQDIYMEVTSPGMERLIKNAAEFALFTGRFVRVWDSSVTDWVPGRIKSSDSESLTLEIMQTEKTGQDQPEIRSIPFARIAKAKLLQI